MRWHLLVGRLLFGGVILCAAARQLIDGSVSDALAAHGVPYPEWVAVASAMFLALAGSSIVLGFLPQVGLRLTALYLAVVSVVVHAFWTAPDPTARSLELAMFLQNVGLIGAAIALLAVPSPWPLSLDSAESIRRAVASVRSAAISLKPRPRPGATALVRDQHDGWDTSIVERPGGTIYRARRTVWIAGGSVANNQRVGGFFRTTYREYG